MTEAGEMEAPVLFEERDADPETGSSRALFKQHRRFHFAGLSHA